MVPAGKFVVIGAIAMIRLSFGASAAIACHHIKLEICANPGAPVIGLAAKVRINSGAPMALLLDSGAQSVVLDLSTAKPCRIQRRRHQLGPGDSRRSRCGGEESRR